MWSALGATVDVAHAVFMAAWVLGLPLLFCHQRPRLRRAYALYAIVFIGLNLASRAALGECFLTSVARACWERAVDAGSGAPVSQEWFSVRLAEAVFQMTPTHDGIKMGSEALILVTAIGVLSSLRRGHPVP
jgi:hypothetical protein